MVWVGMSCGRFVGGRNVKAPKHTVYVRCYDTGYKPVALIWVWYDVTVFGLFTDHLDIRQIMTWNNFILPVMITKRLFRTIKHVNMKDRQIVVTLTPNNRMRTLVSASTRNLVHFFDFIKNRKFRSHEQWDLDSKISTLKM
jgi:hypothetical protein